MNLNYIKPDEEMELIELAETDEDFEHILELRELATDTDTDKNE